MARSPVCSSGEATPRLGRRKVIALAGSGMLAIGFVNRTRAAAPADIQLNVYRKGSPIGTHAIRFSQNGDTLKVTTQIDLRVKVAFITVYSYQQTANDDWENGVLVRTRIQTNDDGKETLVQAEARDGQLTKEPIMVRGQAVEARRFSMTGTKGRSGSVWYDDSGSLVKAVVTTRGETLAYEL